MQKVLIITDVVVVFWISVVGSECAICLEELKNGEECVVFSVCGHIFHFDCIKHWLEKKPTCPNCRHCVASSATMMKTTSMEFLENLVE